jgi:hypothetical protein
MSTEYSPASPFRISAGTAVKFGFFAAIGATLFSLILTVVVSIVIFILVLLGVVTANMWNVPR